MARIQVDNVFDIRHRQEIDVGDDAPLVLEYVYRRFDGAYLGVVMTDPIDSEHFRIVPRFDNDATRRFRVNLYQTRDEALFGLLLAHYATPNLDPEPEKRRSQFSEDDIVRVFGIEKHVSELNKWEKWQIECEQSEKVAIAFGEAHKRIDEALAEQWRRDFEFDVFHRE